MFQIAKFNDADWQKLSQVDQEGNLKDNLNLYDRLTVRAVSSLVVEATP